MIRLWRRLKNLWRLSNFRIEELPVTGGMKIVKDVPTVKKKLATIIPPDTKDEFDPPTKNHDRNTP
jgi:hypothetical protein